MLRKLLREQYNNHQGELAAAIGIEGAFLSEILSGKRGVGPKALAGLEKLSGGAIHQILGLRTIPGGVAALGTAAKEAVKQLTIEGYSQQLADAAVCSAHKLMPADTDAALLLLASRAIAGAYQYAASLSAAKPSSRKRTRRQ